MLRYFENSHVSRRRTRYPINQPLDEACHFPTESSYPLLLLTLRQGKERVGHPDLPLLEELREWGFF